MAETNHRLSFDIGHRLCAVQESVRAGTVDPAPESVAPVRAVRVDSGDELGLVDEWTKQS